MPIEAVVEVVVDGNYVIEYVVGKTDFSLYPSVRATKSMINCLIVPPAQRSVRSTVPLNDTTCVSMHGAATQGRIRLSHTVRIG